MEENKEKHEESTSSLKGTALSVGLVGIVILVTYIVLYGLYMARV